MAAAAEPGEDNQAEEVAQVEALGGGIEAAVDFEGLGGARGAEIGAGDRIHQTPLLQNFDNIGAVKGSFGLN